MRPDLNGNEVSGKEHVPSVDANHINEISADRGPLNLS